MNKKLVREIIGFLIVPFIPALLSYSDKFLEPNSSFQHALFNGVPGSILRMGFFVVIFFGIPLHMFLQRKGKQNLYVYMACGAAVGFALGGMQIFGFGFIGIIYGSVSASAFWLIAVKPFLPEP